MFTDKVYTGLDNAPSAFDLRGRILGPNGNNLEYIKSETGAVVTLRGGTSATDALHVVLQHSRTDKMSDARNLTLNLIETVKNELQQWSAQTGSVTPAAMPAQTAPIPEPVNIAPALPGTAGTGNSPVVAVRPQTVLQLMPQQQYILNQDGSQLIPLIQQGMPHGNFTQLTALPIAPGSFPQTSVGSTQFVDANLQPVTQFRISVPSTMPTFIQNGLALSQVSLANQDTTTVSYTSLLPVSSTVSSPSTGLTATPTGPSTPQKADKMQYQMQVGDQVQTMYIPYQQLQDITAGQQGALHPQLVSISGGTGMNAWQSATSMSIPQITQIPPGTTLNPNILQLNQKPPGTNTSVINLWSAQPGASVPTQIAPGAHIITPTGQVLSGQPMQLSTSQGTTLTPIPNHNQWMGPRAPAVSTALPPGAELIPLNTTLKNTGSQENRGQKRLVDGSPSQIQLRPIAPAGSQTGAQDKSTGRDARWPASTANNASNHTATKGNTRMSSTNTSTSQTSTGSMTITARESTASPARQDKNGELKTNEITKIQQLPNNIHMYAVSNSMQGMSNIAPAPTSIAQPNGHFNQMYIVPSSQTGLQSLPQGAMMGQTLHVGQGGLPIIQSNQLPPGMHYNTVPIMQLPQQMQYLAPGINLNNPGTAQQLGLAMQGQHIINPAMLNNLQANNQHQMAQMNSQSMQQLQTQMIQGSQAANIQYSAYPNTAQTQYVNSQEVMNTSANYAQNQFATQQGNMIVPAQGNIPQQYAPVNAINAANQLNPALPAADARGTVLNGQQNPYPTSNTPNSGNMNQSNTYQAAQQSYTATPINQLVAQQYPTTGSPSVNQMGVSADNSVPQQQNFTQSAQNPEGYPQVNTTNASYANASSGRNTPTSYTANQYGANGNRAWVGQRFPPPTTGSSQYTAPPRATPPPLAGPPQPQQLAQTANNSNYWQYT